jgi:PAS domain S-box-containing protein
MAKRHSPPILINSSGAGLSAGYKHQVKSLLREMDAQFNPDEDSLRLAAIVESSFDAIVSKDLNGIIKTWNRAAERLFGYTAEEAVGRSILLIIPQDRESEEVHILERIRTGETVEPFETVRKRKDGEEVHVEVTISPIRDRSGRIIGASKIARDISDRKEVNRRIQLLVREVNHRVKNQYAVILAMIRETNKRALSAQDFESHIRERIMALSSSHDLLVMADWKGATLSELIAAQLKPFDQAGRVAFSGPPLTLLPNAVQYLGIAFHELATNSAKHGVLSSEEGTINIAWRIATCPETGKTLHLFWEESGGRVTGQPDSRGFGTVVLEHVAPAALNGSGVLQYGSNGVTWTLLAPMDQVEATVASGISETIQLLR